jgi:hypothetical protein
LSICRKLQFGLLVSKVSVKERGAGERVAVGAGAEGVAVRPAATGVFTMELGAAWTVGEAEAWVARAVQPMQHAARANKIQEALKFIISF